MKSSILSLCLFFFSASFLNAQSKDEKDVAAAVESLKLAMLNGDKAALEKVTASQLTYGHSSGKMEDKAAFVEALATGKSDFVSLELTEQTITLNGDVAVVRHKLHGDTNDNGKAGTANIGVLLVWQKQKGQWLLIARQAYKL